jgi:signal peptidase II
VSFVAVITFLLALLFAAGDQLLKMVVVRDVKPIGSIDLVDGLLKLEYSENTGAAFSIMQGGRWIFLAITLVLCIFFIFAMFFYNNHDFFSRAACVLIVGGGIGNAIDRITLSYVVDYISVSFFPAIFNFADCCVVVGAIFLIIHFIFFTEHSKEEKVLRAK